MKKISLFAALACVMIPVVALARGFGGTWRGRGVLHIQDDGSSVTGSLVHRGFKHNITGTHEGPSRVLIQDTRTNIKNGCVTVLHGYMDFVGHNQVRAVITGTDGRCDLPKDYQETRQFTRH